MSTRGREPLRLGLIGAGRWGRAYIRTLREMPGLALARLCSANPESPRLAGPGCRITQSWEEVAAADDLDGVIVATPPALHARMTEAAVRAGHPVMVEKPLTLDLAEARRLQETVAAAGGAVLVNHIHLFHPAWRALREAAAGLGPPRYIRSEGGGWGPFREDTDALWDYGPHDLALCMDLAGGPPAALRARLNERRRTPEGVGEDFSLELDFPGGLRAEVRVSKLMKEKRRRLAVWWEGCAMVFDDLAERRLVRHAAGAAPGERPPPPPGDEGEPLAHGSVPPLTAALEVFARGARGASREGFGLALGVEIVRLLAEAAAQLPPRGEG